MATIASYTLGCKVNQYESDTIIRALEQTGFQRTGFSFPADIYLINTCALTSRAEQKSRQYIKKALASGSSEVIVTGCYVEKNLSDLHRLFPRGKFFNNKEKDRILNYILSRRGKERAIETPVAPGKRRTRALIKIQDGCRFRCSYCIIPQVRPKFGSRPLPEVIKEAEYFIGRGYKELVITGINVGSYRWQQYRLIDLLESIEQLPGQFRFRLSSIEPGTISASFIDRLKVLRRFCPHLHLPLQSGDEKIIRKMNRAYTVEEYFNLAEVLKKSIPHIGLTTDVMVGFPGEDRGSFLKTVSFLQRVSFSGLHIFPFSPRPFTVASRFPSPVPEAEVRVRKEVLKRLDQQLRLKFYSSYVGSSPSVLLEEEKDGYRLGLTGNYIRVATKGGEPNTFVKVKIREVGVKYCRGEIINN